jgi:hypothetical protein
MNRSKLYLESSTISYLTARPSENLVRKFRQERTRQWWTFCDRFELFISETVINEIRLGDPEAARLRLEMAEGIPVLPHSDQVDLLAQVFISAGAVPPNAIQDAYHIAFSAVCRMNYLLTWNQKHIANSVKLRQMEELIFGFQLTPPLIVTPEQLLYEENLLEDENLP